MAFLGGIIDYVSLVYIDDHKVKADIMGGARLQVLAVNLMGSQHSYRVNGSIILLSGICLAGVYYYETERLTLLILAQRKI